MQNILLRLKNLDWILIGASLGLAGIGMLSLYSSSLGRGDFSNFQKQMAFLGIGVMCMFLFSSFDYRILRNNSQLILFLYAIGIVALAGLFFFAPEIRGSKGWYRLWGVSFDPIEYVKLVLALLTAKYFALRHIELYRIRHIIATGFYFLIPALLIAFQPDLGPVLILGILWGVLLLVAGIRLRHLFAIVALGVVVIASGWSVFLLDHQKERIMSFLEPELDPLGIGWSQLQAQIAIGSGGILGQGLGQGTQTQYGFLSDPQTDFIFAAIAEELGLFGVLFLLVFLALLIWRILKIGIEAQDNFSRLYAVGFAVLLAGPAFVNVGMNLGLSPIIGLSLPFVSYGGSALIANSIGLGILLSIKAHYRISIE